MYSNAKNLKLKRGQILPLTTLTIVGTPALAALAIDVGMLWNTRREMQAAADAAATAGVDDLAIADTTDVVSDAKTASAKNGFTDGGTTTVSSGTIAVSVTNPPTSGPFKGNANAVGVTVTQDQPTYFMQFIPGLNLAKVTLSAFSTGLTTTGGACVFGLDPSASKTVSIGGTASYSSQCGLYDNSNNSSDALYAGGGGVITAPIVGVVGGTTTVGGGSTPPVTGIPAFGDPLAYVSEPSVGSCSGGTKGTTLQGTVTVTAGSVFCGGLSINAGAVVTFPPGLYVIDGGGMSIAGGATVSGSGVTFYITGDNTPGGSWKSYGGVNINSAANVNLSAPSNCAGSGSGGINGMLFFQDRSIIGTATNGSIINGSATSTFDGALYFPTTNLTYSGTSSASGYTYLISDTLTINGNTTINNNYSCLSGGSLIKSAALVQ